MGNSSFFYNGRINLPPNLLVNPGAEDSLANWIILEGVVEALTDGVCNGVTPKSGNRYFIVGGLCESSAVARCIQNIDVSMFADSIDSGIFPVNFGGYLSDYGASDLPEMKLIFLDQDSFELGTSNTLATLNPSWTLFSEWTVVPAQTRTIVVELKGTRNAGTDNDSYFDDLFLRLGTNNIDCNESTSMVNQPILNTPLLNIYPNPLNTTGYILLPKGNFSKIKLFLVDANGFKIKSEAKHIEDKVIFEKRNLTEGIYFFYVRDNGRIIGKGKVIII